MNHEIQMYYFSFAKVSIFLWIELIIIIIGCDNDMHTQYTRCFTVDIEDFLNFIEYITKRPYKNIPALFAVTPLYNIQEELQF